MHHLHTVCWMYIRVELKNNLINIHHASSPHCSLDAHLCRVEEPRDNYPPCIISSVHWMHIRVELKNHVITIHHASSPHCLLDPHSFRVEHQVIPIHHASLDAHSCRVEEPHDNYPFCIISTASWMHIHLELNTK